MATLLFQCTSHPSTVFPFVYASLISQDFGISYSSKGPIACGSVDLDRGVVEVLVHGREEGGGERRRNCKRYRRRGELLILLLRYN